MKDIERNDIEKNSLFNEAYLELVAESLDELLEATMKNLSDIALIAETRFFYQNKIYGDQVTSYQNKVDDINDKLESIFLKNFQKILKEIKNTIKNDSIPSTQSFSE